MTRPLPRFKVDSPSMALTRQTDIDDIRYNQLVQYINAALYGGIGWTGPTYTYDGQSRATSAVTTNLDNAVQVRVDFIYHLSGQFAGLCSMAALLYSDDGGTSWVTIGVRVYTYTTGGDMLPPQWIYA